VILDSYGLARGLLLQRDMTRQIQRVVSIAAVIVLWSATAQAQDYAPCPAPAEPCTLAVCEMTCPTLPEAVPAPPVPTAMPVLTVPPPTDTGSIHRYLLNTSSDYRSARRSRTAGILLSTIGGSLGMLLAIGGAVVCNDESPCSSEDKAMAYGGLIGGVLALGIGIPVAVSGQRRMRELRAAYLPQVGFAVGPRSGRFHAAWRF